MALKKSELYSHIWKSCDELRGGMDASQYKDYVLSLLFVKYVTDKYFGKKNALIDVPDGGSFKDMVALKGKPDIGDQMNKIIGKLAAANELKGVIDEADFNDADKLGKGKEMVDRLSNLISIFETDELNFSKNRAGGDDLLGDAYEYLMRNFATQSGKSKGQFYTPAEVSRVIAQVIGINEATSQSQTLYDPTCGSGSLLLKADDETPNGITIYGQEMDNTTRALAVMNMWLHERPDAEIKQGNTLSSPLFLDEKTGGLKTFDFCVANPPFSNKSWSNGLDPLNDEYGRFTNLGIPPAKNGDYAFLLHLLRSMKSTGKGAIILPHGVLFRGNAEAEIRQNIIRRGYIKGIIGLPSNLFFGTGIPACIIVLDKENADVRKGIFLIDASKEYMKDGNKNRLRERDIHKIVDVFNKQLDIPKYSRMVSVSEIEGNEYNLNIPRYIDSSEEEDIQDIEAHLLGGIPDYDIDAMDKYWKVYPSLKKSLFTKNSREGYSDLKVKEEEIKQTIFTHPEFAAFTKEVDSLFNGWKERSTKLLKGMSVGVRPYEVIETISENILKTFSNKELIDKYDIYQHLMTYWNETMQDDVYIISNDGWKAEVTILNKKKNEWDCELVPKQLVINRYFKKEQEEIEELESRKELVANEMTELEEENSGEEGLLEEVKNDNGKITKANLKQRMKEIKDSPDFKDELIVLEKYLGLFDRESAINSEIKDATAELDKKVLSKYRTLTEEEIKTLVVNDKWLAAIHIEIKNGIEQISQKLTWRIKELAERYELPLPQLKDKVDKLAKEVDCHLQKMGFVW